MNLEPFLIAPWEGGGLTEYYKPFLIGNEAFPIIDDAYCWRGTVSKREGNVLLGALPTAPVQGLATYYVPSTGDQQLVAFSDTNAYLFDTVTSAFIDISFNSTPAAITWTGTTDDYFWSTNFAKALWTTNNVDYIRFWNGTSASGWANQRPLVGGGARVDTCLMLIPYKGRLVMLSTVEGGTAFKQRARWSQLGTPYVPAVAPDPAAVPPTPFTTDANAWNDSIPGKGSFVDADTTERIISCGIIRDVLIVFFQRSTWRLRYSGNEVLPFYWERINTQYGADSTFGTIPFDEHLLTYSRYGFIAADTNAVRRIDEKIPDQSFQIEAGTTQVNLNRVHGIRDFYRQTAYWAYPDIYASVVPNKVLTYNYLDQTWSRFNQAFRCYGYYNVFNDVTWAASTSPWEDSDDAWASPWQQAGFPQVVAGDASLTSGNVYIVYDTTFQDREQVQRTITNVSIANPAVVTTSVAHGLLTNDSVYFQGVTGTMAASINGLRFNITVISPTTFSILLNTAALTYTGGGTVTGGTNFNFNITTKRFNPYLKEGRRCRLAYVDLYCTTDPGSEITCDLFTDDEDDTPVISRAVNLSTGTTGTYVRVFFGTTARLVQLRLRLTDAQLADRKQGGAYFELQGMVMWFSRGGILKR